MPSPKRRHKAMPQPKAKGKEIAQEINEKLLPNRGKWDAFSSRPFAQTLLTDFRMMGGDVELVRTLWEEYEAPPDGTKEAKYMWRQIAVGLESVGAYRNALGEIETCAPDGFDEKLFDLQNIAECEQSFLSVRKPIDWPRHYWVGALLPYLDLIDTRRQKWQWLADWVGALNGLRTRADAKAIEPFRQWTNSVRRRFRTQAKVLFARRAKTRQAVYDQLGVLVDERKRDLSAVSYGLLHAVQYLKHQPRDKKEPLARRYIAKAYARWPFFKLVLPRLSCI
jgi:hypothetical protein